MQGLQKIRDSYHVSLWLTGEAATWISSQFPEDDLEVGLAKLIDRAMGRSRRSSVPKVAKQSVKVAPVQTTLEPAKVPTHSNSVGQAQPQVQEAKKERSVQLSNPVGSLQERCQKAGLDLPKYEFSECREGFACSVSALGLEATGIGRSKQNAKRDAAIGLLEMLGGASV